MGKAISTIAAAMTLGALGSIATQAQAEVSFSANVGLVSDYKFRGMTQTDGNPALQGGVDLDLGNGLYLGTWASQVDFAYGEDETDYEQDFYGGYGGEISETVSYDIGYAYYAYHGSDWDEDYQEFYGSLSISDLTLGFAYSDDYWGGTGAFYYPYAEYSFALPSDMSLGFHLGVNLFDEEGFLYEADSYIDYSVTLSKELGGLSLSASLVGTDVSDSECYDTDWCEPSVIAGVTYSW